MQLEEVFHNDDVLPKRRRHRKKQLYTSILQQMEFYFSDSNLAKDRFLSQLVNQDPFVDLELFLKFNKIRKLTSKIDDIRKALKNSKLLAFNETETKVKRKEPVKFKEDTEECTIYVEGLKSDVNHEWIKSIFIDFGTVTYISIPKYKQSNLVKGFAFVEFDKREEAESALNYFEEIGCKMPSNTEPDQLCSIVTYINETEEGAKITEILKDNEVEEEKEGESKKRKAEETNGDETNEAKKMKLETVGDQEDKMEEISDISSENRVKKRLKREQKRKLYIRELGLQILSKKEWKKMRNRYLDLQKKKMKEFKQHLLKARFGQSNFEKKHHDENKEQKKNGPPKSKLEFTPGVIVKIKLTEPCIDAKKLKNEIKTACADVNYVDVPCVNSEEVFVRFSSPKAATDFCKNDGHGEKTILNGEIEQTYWAKLTEQRETKLRRESTKQRGRDKLRKKAAKLASHIVFDD